MRMSLGPSKTMSVPHLADLRNHLHETSTGPLWVCAVGR